MQVMSKSRVVNALGIVVVALAVFAVFAGPDHSSVHERAHAKTHCINNMKQLGTLLNMYSTDNGGKLPSSYLIRHSKAWNPQDFETFASVYGDPDIKTGGIGSTWVALLSPYMKNTDIIWCPADRSKERTSATARVSYYYKAAVDRAWYGDKNSRFQKIDDFGAPADQVVFWERNSFHWQDEEQSLREGSSMNVAYLDGHVATRRITNCGYSTSENPPGPLPASGKGEPAWFNAGTKDGNPQTGQFWDPRIYCDLLE